MAGPPIGIDLGTTYCCAALVRNGKPQVIESRLGYKTIPSVVHFDQAGQITVGQPAERRMVLEPERSIYGSKRLLGRSYRSNTRKKYQPHFAYELVADSKGMVGVNMDGQVVPLTDVSARILRELKGQVQAAIGEIVERAVVTVPAYFTERQRACVRIAGARAGLDVIRVVNEPTAAALAYGHGRSEKKTVLVFDLGGGTFDLSLVRIEGDVFEVIAVGGNNFLGGIDFDRKLLEIVLGRLAHGGEASDVVDEVGLERLRVACQEAKHELSTREEVEIVVPKLQLNNGETVDISKRVTRREFNRACENLVAHCMKAVGYVLEDGGLDAKGVDDVLLVGGSTRMPCVRSALVEMFKKEPSKRVHPDEVVALGAAIAAEACDKETGAELTDVVPTAIGVANARKQFVPLVARNTKLPHQVTASVEIASNTKEFKLAVYQGEAKDVRRNDYLGALILSDLPEVDRPVKCQLAFRLNAECLLTAYAAIPELKVKTKVVLVTGQTPEDVLDEMGAERIKVRAPEMAKPLRDEQQNSPQEAPSADNDQGTTDAEDDEDDAPKQGVGASILAWMKGLFSKKAA